MRRTMRRGLILAGCALALAACSKEGGKEAAQGPVILKINDRSYTATEVEREIAQERRRIPRELQPLLATTEGQKQVLDRLVRRELMLQEAEKRKIAAQPEVADQLANFRREVLLRTLIQAEIGAKVKVEEQDVQDYFRSHPDEFSGDRIRARHILVESEDEARQVLDRLKQNESFEALARAVSRDTATAPRGGDLDYFSREQMVPEFAQAAFALKPGEVSGMVKTAFGFHVIKLVDRKKGQPLTFEQVKGQLYQRLLEERQSQRFQAWLKELEGAAKITRDDSFLPLGAPGPGAEKSPKEGRP